MNKFLANLTEREQMTSYRDIIITMHYTKKKIHLICHASITHTHIYTYTFLYHKSATMMQCLYIYEELVFPQGVGKVIVRK